MYVCVRVYVCARTHIYYIRHSISNATGMREYSGNPPCVSANIQRMQLSIPATGHLSACPPPSFFHIGTFHGKKTNWPAFISRSRWTLFFFFFLLFMIYVAWHVCVRGLSVLAALFLNIVIIFCRFFFFFREREREIVSPEGRANFHEGSCMDSLREGLDGTMRILSSAGLFNSGGPRCKWI